MNQTIVKNWNDTVSETDLVFFLGDFCKGNPKKWLIKLNGKIIFVKGNHDKEIPVKTDEVILVHEEEVFLLQHYPPIVPQDYWVIHGHVHNNDMENYPFISAENRSINVSVETLLYRPISMNDLVRLRKDTIGTSTD